jgi:hypothetical protein
MMHDEHRDYVRVLYKNIKRKNRSVIYVGKAKSSRLRVLINDTDFWTRLRKQLRNTKITYGRIYHIVSRAQSKFQVQQGRHRVGQKVCAAVLLGKVEHSAALLGRPSWVTQFRRWQVRQSRHLQGVNWNSTE